MQYNRFFFCVCYDTYLIQVLLHCYSLAPKKLVPPVQLKYLLQEVKVLFDHSSESANTTLYLRCQWYTNGGFGKNSKWKDVYFFFYFYKLLHLPWSSAALCKLTHLPVDYMAIIANRPEAFYTCETPQLTNGSDVDQIGVCQEVCIRTSPAYL